GLAVAQGLELLDRDLRHPGRGGLGNDTAKRFVIDQLRNGRVRTADDTVGIFAQLELSKTHPQSVDQEEAPDQRLSTAENELDRLSRLNDAEQPRQDPEDSPLRAGGHESRRRRLRVETPVARALLRPEHRCLPFETKDRSVDVRLAGEDAGVVD